MAPVDVQTVHTQALPIGSQLQKLLWSQNAAALPPALILIKISTADAHPVWFSRCITLPGGDYSPQKMFMTRLIGSLQIFQ